MADCPSVSESVARIRWFEDLLTPVLAEVSDLPIRRLACEGTLRLEDLYADAGLTPSLEAWAELYAGVLPAALADRLASLYRDALVISKEMPPSMALALRNAGVPFIDCMVDPHRFLSDIPLSWRSSSPEVVAAIEPFRLTSFEIRRRVAQMRSKSRWMGTFEVPENATLVLDQIPSDSAMIDPRRRRRVSWLDYREQLRALSTEAPIVWRPHPCRQPADEVTEMMGQATRVDVNIYRLLSHDNLTRVVAISSGGVIEARAFGKEGCHLLDRYAGIDLDGWGTPLPVVGHWVSPHFWSAALEPLMPVRAEVPVVSPEKDFFRRSINCDWGFDRMDRVVVHEQRELRHDDLEQRTRQVEDRNAELERRTIVLQDRNMEAEDRARNVDARNAELERRIVVLEARNADVERYASDLDAHNTELERRAGEATAQLDAMTSRAETLSRQLHRVTAADRARVQRVVDDFVGQAMEARLRVGILGVGAHTTFLLEATSLGCIPQLFLFDNDPHSWGREVNGRHVHPSSDIPSLSLDAVVVSSLAFQDEMAAQLEALNLPALRIVRCYPWAFESSLPLRPATTLTEMVGAAR